MRFTNILLVEQHLMPDFLTQPTLHPTNTHIQAKKDTVCLIISAHPTCSPHNLFSNSYHDECTSFFFITHLPKNKRKHLFHKSWKFTQTEFNYTYIHQVQEINTNLSHNMNELALRALWFLFHRFRKNYTLWKSATRVFVYLLLLLLLLLLL